MRASNLSVVANRGIRPTIVRVVALAALAAGIAGVAVAVASPPALTLPGTVLAAAAFVGVAHARRRLGVVLTGLSLIALFSWIYISHLSVVYGYAGTRYTQSDPFDWLLATAISAAPLLWLPIGVQRPSQAIIWLMFVFAYVPTVMVPFFLAGSIATVAPLVVTVAFAMGLLVAMTQGKPSRTLNVIELTDGQWTALLVTLLGAMSAYIVISFGLPSSIPGIESVYDVRQTYKDELAGAVGPVSYVVAWAGTVVAPLLFAAGLARRRPSLVVLASLAILLIYSLTGFKSVVFGPILAVALFVLIRYGKAAFGARLLGGFTIVLAGATAWTLATGNPWGLALLPQRLLALPGVLSAHYFEYFGEHEVFLLRHSVLSILGQAPSDLAPANLIGLVYLGGASVSANANLWADGIANFGLAGALLMTIFFGVGLRLLDMAAVDCSLLVVVPSVGLMALRISNSGTLTTFLTGGFLLFVILVGLLPKDRPDAQREPAAPTTS